MFSLKALMLDLLQSEIVDTPYKRNEIWSSDLGKPYIDRYLQMKGTQYSNPFTVESIQNFNIGHSVERGFKNLLKLCMIEYEKPQEQRMTVQLDGCLPVVVRPDVVIEVKDWDKVKDRIKNLPDNENGRVLSPERKQQRIDTLLKVVERWEKNYANGLPKTPFEVKSIAQSSMKYNKIYGGIQNANPQYHLQLYSQMRALGSKTGVIVYIVKNMGKYHGWIEEVFVQDTPELQARWEKDIREFSKYFKENKQPPLEPLWDKRNPNRVNWHVSSSLYYDLLYKEQVEKEQQERESEAAAETQAIKDDLFSH